MNNKLSRRTLIKSIGLAATGSLSGSIYSLMASESQDFLNDDIYDFPMLGQVRLLHTTDIHAQLNPIYFREPNVNLGISSSSNMLPHLVALLSSINCLFNQVLWKLMHTRVTNLKKMLIYLVKWVVFPI